MGYIKFLIILAALHILTLTACEREDMFDFAKNGTSHKWEYAGTAGISAGAASSISIAVDDNTPYVAYLDGSVPKVVKYNGSSWMQVGSNIDISATEIAMAMDGATPYVIYTNGSTYIKKFDGSSWISVGASPGSTSSNEILIIAGVPYIGYYSSNTFILNYTVVWGQQGANLNCTASASISLATDGTTLYVAYQDNATGGGKLKVRHDSLSSPLSWPDIPASLWVTSGVADYISSIMYSGRFTVSFMDGANSSKVTVMQYDGAAWNTLGPAGFSEGAASYVSMTTFEGVPHVAFRDEYSALNKITAMRYEKGSWVVDDIPRFTPSTVGEVSLAGGSRKMFVAFSDNSVSGRLSVMQY